MFSFRRKTPRLVGDLVGPSGFQESLPIVDGFAAQLENGYAAVFLSFFVQDRSYSIVYELDVR